MNIKFEDCWDTETERAVIGYGLICRENYDALARIVRPADFWLFRHARLWKAIGQLQDMDFLIVSRVAEEMHPAELAKCLNTWLFLSGELSDAWLDRKWEGLTTNDLLTDEELALRLARQLHALATMRRVGLRLEKILHYALAT